MTKRTEPDLVSEWSYDKKFDASSCGKGVGKLCEAKADNGYKRTHTYDSKGRVSSTATVLDSPSTPATVSVAYDANSGRVSSQTWPTGYPASYEYSALGYLKKVTGGGSGGFTQTVTYEVLAMDAQGHVTQYKQGSQVTTVRTYDSATGRLTAQAVTKQGQANGNVLNQSYGYDALSNLTSRGDSTSGVGTSETFAYDSLNRLNLYTIVGGAVSPPKSVEVLYDARGNIAYKSDVGRYWYDAQRPNRMTQVTLETAPGASVALSGTRALSYAFDDLKTGAQSVGGVTVGNGNLEYTVSQDTVNARHTYRGETYTSFNMPNTITYGNVVGGVAGTSDRTLSFVYGPEHQRIKQVVQLSGNAPTSYNAGTTWYLNGEDSLGLTYEKEVRTSGMTEHKHYVNAAGVTFALFVSRTGTLGSNPATATRYMHPDHLGSVAVLSDESGAVTERLAYDPWGKRRYVNGTGDTLDAIVGVGTDRGFTMHEHLDEIGVIHMNGRIYDPLIGRFMSADPYVQSMANLQSHNRYAYVLNNPLSNTDPSGFFFKQLFKKVILRVVAAVADSMGCAGYCTMALNAYSGYKSGGIAGLLASFIPGADNLYADTAISAAKGCVVASINDGNCGRAIGSSLIQAGANEGGFFVATVGGCLASRNQRGSCSDGASSVAAAYLSKGIVDHAKAEAERIQFVKDLESTRFAGLAIVPIIVEAPTIGSWIWGAAISVAVAAGLYDLDKHQWVLSANESKGDEEGGANTKSPSSEAPYPNNPDNSDFDRIKGGGAKINPEDGSVWERDNTSHGGSQWKRWPNKKSWERGDRPNSIWPDGRIRK